MIGQVITGTDLAGSVVTGTVMDKVTIPQQVSIGSSLQQGGGQMIIPYDAYLVRLQNNSVTIISVTQVKGVAIKANSIAN